METPSSAEPRIILRGRDIEMRPSRSGGRRIDLAAPWCGSPVRTLHVFLREVPPGGQSGMHRHRNEAVLHILKGRGHSDVEGVRYDWEAGDTLCVPMWSWHTNCNDDPDNPARYLACINRPLMEALGVWEIEDPDEEAMRTYAR